MAKRISLSQWKSQMNQAINKYNNAVRKYNSEAKRAVNDYNQQVRRHNSAVRTNKQKLINAISDYNRSSHTVARYSVSYTFRTSVEVLNRSYQTLDHDTRNYHGGARALLVDYPEQETANTLLLYNSLQGNDTEAFELNESLGQTVVENQLIAISAELEKRWRGALFSLSPTNPDAARHFCTSVREIFIRILDIKAPDQQVLSFPGCVLLPDGKPNRKSKIKYLMSRQNIAVPSFENFMDADIGNLLDLFRELNDGTHGDAGRFGVPQLLRLKKRVEDAILFVTSFSN